MAQIREFESTTESYFILDGVSYPKVYEAMLDNGYSDTKIKLVGTNRDTTPLVFSTEYTNILVDGEGFDTASEAISRLNQVVFSKGGGSGGGGTTGDFIPLTGTEIGKPVTGNLFFNNNNNSNYFEVNTSFQIIDKSSKNSITFLPDGDVLGNGSLLINNNSNPVNNESSSISIKREMIIIGSYNNPDFSGLIGDIDYSDKTVDNNLYYAQRSYVNRANSYSAQETKTGGTWVDGKPIYTITQLTADPAPSDIETQFPNIIVGSYTVYKYTKTTGIV